MIMPHLRLPFMQAALQRQLLVVASLMVEIKMVVEITYMVEIDIMVVTLTCRDVDMVEILVRMVVTLTCRM